MNFVLGLLRCRWCSSQLGSINC